MAILPSIKRSKEEVLDTAARLVAGTINPTKMGLSPEEVNVEDFIEYFKLAAETILDHKEVLYIAIGLHANTGSFKLYSGDMQTILECIHSVMDVEFHFHDGIVLWLYKNELYVGYLPQ